MFEWSIDWLIEFSLFFGKNCCTVLVAPLPDNTCVTYRKIATDPTATQSGLILSGGPGFTSKVELPSQTNWVPLCDQNGLYLPLQTRQNGQQFCVLPQTGEIAFDPFKTQQAPIKMPIFCACFVARQTVISGNWNLIDSQIWKMWNKTSTADLFFLKTKKSPTQLFRDTKKLRKRYKWRTKIRVLHKNVKIHNSSCSSQWFFCKKIFYKSVGRMRSIRLFSIRMV